MFNKPPYYVLVVEYEAICSADRGGERLKA